MTETKLKPCPFCGGEASFVHKYYSTNDYIVVECEVCNISTRPIRGTGETSVKAARRWNLRTEAKDD